jgi:hypothetical protein
MPDPTTHQSTEPALPIAWGHFARSLCRREHWHPVPLAQKTVHHTPQAKLLTRLIALLAGSESLADVSLGPAPIARAPARAPAWGLPCSVRTWRTRRDHSGRSGTNRRGRQPGIDQAGPRV